MTDGYDLWEEPWIPVRFKASGRLATVGFYEALTQAHEILELTEPAPTLRFGLYRVMTALITSLFRFADLDHWEACLEEPRFSREAIDRYREENAHRFRLFDRKYPFMQTAVDDPGELKPIVELLQHIPSGTFATHFCHGQAKDQRWSPAVCARALTAVPAFTTAGGAGYSPSINGAPPWYVLVRGETLQKTLLLNSVFRPEPELGEPAWRQEERVRPKEGRRSFTLLEGLTWQPRTIQLIPGPPGRCTYSGEEFESTVSQMVFTFGLKVSEPENWRDPAVAYRFEERGRSSLKPQEGKQAWRDYVTFALSNPSHPRAHRPELVSQLQKLAGLSRPVFELDCFGLRTDNMKVFEWRHERLELPAGLLEARTAEESYGEVKRALDWAEDLARFMRQALRKAYPREAASNKKALERFIEQGTSLYWDRLHTVFNEFLCELGGLKPSQRDDSRLRQSWREIATQIASRILEQSLDQLGWSGRSLQREALARRYFYGTIKKISA